MTRRFARELALQTLYNVEIGHNEPAVALGQTMADIAAGDPEGRTFVRELVFGTLEFSEASDAIVGPLLAGWTLDRLATVDRIVLRMAMFELDHTATPRAVVLDEAVELAKKFSTEDAARFVNGVLAAASATRTSG